MIKYYCQIQQNRVYYNMAKENLIKNKALELCMKAGESVTPNRVNILDLLIENKDPLAAYEIKDMLKKSNNDLNISS